MFHGVEMTYVNLTDMLGPYTIRFLMRDVGHFPIFLRKQWQFCCKKLWE